MKTLRENALNKIFSGITTIEEVNRAINADSALDTEAIEDEEV